MAGADDDKLLDAIRRQLDALAAQLASAQGAAKVTRRQLKRSREAVQRTKSDNRVVDVPRRVQKVTQRKPAKAAGRRR